MKGRMREFRQYLHGPYNIVGDSYWEIQNFDKAMEFSKKALQCVPAELSHYWFCLLEQIRLAQDYVSFGGRSKKSDAKNSLRTAMIGFRQSMGVEEELFLKLFPEALDILNAGLGHSSKSKCLII